MEEVPPRWRCSVHFSYSQFGSVVAWVRSGEHSLIPSQYVSVRLGMSRYSSLHLHTSL